MIYICDQNNNYNERLYEFSTTVFSKEKFTQWGDSDDEGYGLTETSPLISFSMNRWRTAGSTGYPVHNVQVKLIDVNPETGEGEIVVKARLLKVVNKNVNKTSQVSSIEVMKEPFEKTATMKIRRFKYKDSAPTVEEERESKKG